MPLTHIDNLLNVQAEIMRNGENLATLEWALMSGISYNRSPLESRVKSLLDDLIHRYLMGLEIPQGESASAHIGYLSEFKRLNKIWQQVDCLEYALQRYKTTYSNSKGD